MRQMKKPGTPRARQRNAAMTRAAILSSARQAFARAGYDGVGVREIATGAGVTAMLVNRYFGSKEQLFAEVVADIVGQSVILTRTADVQPQPTRSPKRWSLLRRPAGHRSTASDHAPLGLKSLAPPRSAAGRSKRTTTRRWRPRSGRTRRRARRASPRPRRGLQMMRQMIGITALAGCPPAVLSKILAPVLQQLWAGESRSPRRPRSVPAIPAWSCRTARMAAL